MKPLVMRSDLTNPPRYYVVTRYREKVGIAIDGETRSYLVTQTKYDVTEQVQGLIDAAILKAKPRNRRAR